MSTSDVSPKAPKKHNTADSSEKRKYEVRVPSISFEDAIKLTREISRVGGFDDLLNAALKVTGNPKTSSSFVYKIIAMKKFGLIVVQGDSYSLTDIGRRIVQSDSPEKETQAIFEAFCSHDILAKAWETYKGKLLPQTEYLATHFESNYPISAERKDSWPPYFIEAAKFAGLLHERETGSYQVLMGPTPIKESEQSSSAKAKTEPTKRQESQIETLTKNPSLPNIGVTESEHWGILSQRRISGNRKAVIAIPDDLSQEDIDMLKVILKGIDTQLDGLKKYEGE
jgi:hypothetical protein